MTRSRAGTVGILPAGALGVAFFYHLTGELSHGHDSVRFFERAGSRSARNLRGKPLKIAHDGVIHRVEAQAGTLAEAYSAGSLPEVLLICPNPDQLTTVLGEFVQLLEHAHKDGELAAMQGPTLVLSSNGIYYQRQRQLLIERLEESTLLGRLPDLWPDQMPRIIGRLLRGVTIQTGTRDGSGADACYYPGPRGLTRLAGGDAAVRERACTILSNRGSWFELAGHSSATQLEFDKAMVNLISNLLGQLSAIAVDGTFTPLRVREILTEENQPRIRELIQHVVEVGRAVKAYDSSENLDAITTRVIATTRQHEDHVPSSLQWVHLRVRQRKLAPELTPTEQWLLDPLIRYAHAAELHDTAHFFESLRAELLAKLQLTATRHSG